MKSRNFLSLPAMLVAAGLLFGQSPFYLKDGDRVVFYGDSITDQRLYTTFVESFVLTRFPERKIDFVHSGWGGDRVTGGGGGTIDVRLQRDVLTYRPTVVTIMLGMNDGRYRAHEPDIFQTYSSGYEKIVTALKTALPQTRITLIRPSPYDDVTRAPLFEGGYNSVLVRYGDFVADLARRSGVDVADLNAPVAAALEKAKAADPEVAQKIVPDRVHPAAGGHLLMAAALLHSWKAPALVTAVEIDAAARRVTAAENTAVTLDAGENLAWTQVDRALPMPVDWKEPVLSLAVRSSDFVSALDWQPLRITGLAAPRYVLRIDSQDVGTFSKEELATGINLAMFPTPMLRQALGVHALTLKHNNIHFVRWRQVQVPLETENVPSRQGALAALDNLEAELVTLQRAAAQPKPHRFELQPASN
jgi:lysophospholipase L1-like esterase